MKKTLIVAAVAAIAALSSQAQGLVSINQTLQVIKTNTTTSVSGFVDGSGAYNFVLLYSADTALASTANQLLGNAGNVSLWTDSGVTGVNGFGISRGKLTSGTSVAATGWTVPGASYDNLRSVIIVGWSAAYGASWSAISAAVASGNLAAGGYFGVTAVGTSYAGGGTGSLPAVSAWSANAIPGATPMGNSLILQQVAAVPEPGTLVLAGLGGLSLLAFRRKK